MITEKQLTSSGWTNSLISNGDYYYKDLTISLENDKVVFIREKENFHGLSVNIKTISELETFLKFIPR